MSTQGLLPTGTRLGAFEIEGFIARGGMGVVYAAKNALTGDLRALKVLAPEVAAQPEFVERFMREIRVAMKVSHPNLVRVFEPGMSEDTVFLPMELLSGETLASRLRRVSKLAPGEAIALASAIGSAVAALHDAGIMHRDLKPSNFFLSIGEGGACVPKLLDLGAARAVGLDGEMTSTGLAVGSPHYMSPEQAAGKKGVDARTDQYSLGVAFYQMLTGQRPYENDDSGHVVAKVIAGAKFKSPRELDPTISEALDQAVMRALAGAPADRYESVTAMIAALRAAIDDDKTIVLPAPPTDADATRIQPIEARPAKKTPLVDPNTVAPVSRRGGSSARAGNVGTAIALVVSLSVAAFLLWQRVKPQPPEPPPANVATVRAPATATATAPPRETTVAPAPAPTPIETVASTRTAVPTATAPPAPRSDGGHVARRPPIVAPPPCKPTPGAPCL